jgi:Superfamily II DNA helicase
MIQFCQTTQCRTRYILEHFGEEIVPEWRCRNCDACDEMEARHSSRVEQPKLQPNEMLATG